MRWSNSATSSDNLLRDWFLSIGSQLIAPLFDGGERRAEVDRNAALVSQRFSEFRQSTLIAFQEVEDSLALEYFQIQRIERLNEQVELASQSTEQLRLGYFLTPDTNFLDYLSATQSQQRLQREILSARLDLVLIRVGLYLALAGDFDTRPQLVADSPFGNEVVVTSRKKWRPRGWIRRRLNRTRRTYRPHHRTASARGARLIAP